MKIAIHQPNYFPNKNYFNKIKNSDIFVLLDDVQFEKNGFTNRNRIPTKNSDIWLTIPIIHKFGQLISEVKIFNDNWKVKHKKTLENIYGKSIFLDEFFNYESDLLIDWNIHSLNYMGIYEKKYPCFVLSSNLNIKSVKTQRIIDICKHFQANTYLSGNGAKKYIDMDLFEQNNIKIEFMPIVDEPYSILNTILK